MARNQRAVPEGLPGSYDLALSPPQKEVEIMRKTMALAALALLANVSLPGQETATTPDDPAARVAALKKEFKQANDDWMQSYRAASKAERGTLMTKRPNPDDYVPKFLGLANEFETIDQDGAHEAAGTALAWVAMSSRTRSIKDSALDRLRTGHMKSEEITAVSRSISRVFRESCG